MENIPKVLKILVIFSKRNLKKEVYYGGKLFFEVLNYFYYSFKKSQNENEISS